MAEAFSSDVDLSSQTGNDDTENESDVHRPGKCSVSVELTEVTDLDIDASDSEPVNCHRKPGPGSRKKPSVLNFIRQLDCSSPDWYKHNSFKSYWEHYNQAMGWCKLHFETNRNIRQQRQTISPFLQGFSHPYYAFNVNSNISGYSHSTEHQSETSDSCKPKIKRGGRRRRRNKKQSESESSVGASVTHSEFEMEITPDMIDFFAKSDEHRRQRGRASISYIHVVLSHT